MSQSIKNGVWETARYYRSLGPICRQQAVRHPEANWNWLSEAQRWEDLAAREQQAASAAQSSLYRPASSSR
jgi:hypothetical protein